VNIRHSITVPSQARKAFDLSAKDVQRLLDIHADVGGDAPGKRYGLEVLNKSAIVLISAVWEAYCEDVALEAAKHLAKYLTIASELPLDVQKRIAFELKRTSTNLQFYDSRGMAGSRW